MRRRRLEVLKVFGDDGKEKLLVFSVSDPDGIAAAVSSHTSVVVNQKNGCFQEIIGVLISITHFTTHINNTSLPTCCLPPTRLPRSFLPTGCCPLTCSRRLRLASERRKVQILSSNTSEAMTASHTIHSLTINQLQLVLLSFSLLNYADERTYETR